MKRLCFFLLALVVSAGWMLGHPGGAAWAQLQEGRWCSLWPESDKIYCEGTRMEMNGTLVEFFDGWDLEFRGQLQGNEFRGYYTNDFMNTFNGCGIVPTPATGTVSNNGKRIEFVYERVTKSTSGGCTVLKTKKGNKQIYVLKPW